MSDPVAPTVAVRGTATRRVPPDFFVLIVHVQGIDKSSAAAHQRLVARFAEVEDAVAALPQGTVRLRRGEIQGWQSGRRGEARWTAAREVRLRGRDFTTTADVLGMLGALRDRPRARLACRPRQPGIS